MQLSPGEKALLAYFPTADAARKAAEEMDAAGLGITQVDRISRYGASVDAHYNNPINRAVTITGPTLFSDSSGENLSDSERVLMGADPSASGYGDTDYGVAGGNAFLLTLVTSEDKSSQAERIIKEHGGKL